jgi:FtsH-binding integral membrane protein
MFGVRHKHPWNYIVLAAFTACTSYSLGVVTLAYSPQAVLAALALTATAMGALTGLAYLLRNRDLSMFGLGLMATGLVFLGALLVLSFVSVSAQGSVVIGALGAALFSAYVVFDVWLMMTPWRGLGLDEHFLAAMNLYLDFLNIFMFTLQAIGGAQRQ